MIFCGWDLWDVKYVFSCPPPSPLLTVSQWSESIHKSCQALCLVIINQLKNFIVYWPVIWYIMIFCTIILSIYSRCGSNNLQKGGMEDPVRWLVRIKIKQVLLYIQVVSMFCIDKIYSMGIWIFYLGLDYAISLLYKCIKKNLFLSRI